jgi:hypothetical protein
MLTSTSEGASLNISLAWHTTQGKLSHPGALLTCNDVVEKDLTSGCDDVLFRLQSGLCADLHDDVEGKSPVYGLLYFELLQHGYDKVQRQHVACVLTACAGDNFVLAPFFRIGYCCCAHSSTYALKSIVG